MLLFDFLILWNKNKENIKIYALESRDLFHTDTIIIVVSSFPKLTHIRNDCLLN